MNQVVFTIKDHSDITKTISYLHSNYSKASFEGKPLIVNISTKQEQRSHAQNRLMWLWYAQIEKSTGQDKDSVHHEMKKRFLINILREDAEFNAMCMSIAALKDNEPEQFKAIAHGVIHLASTTKMNTKQFTEYLNRIEAFALAKLGIKLFVPEDLMFTLER